jgi:hypothetical protein
LGFHFFETQRVSGITGGPSGPARGGNRATIGLRHFGSTAAATLRRAQRFDCDPA